MVTVTDTQKCVGCRSCELACSFHHRKLFRPGIASIHVQRNEYRGNFDVRLVHYQQAEDGHLPCDCSRENEFCVRYCPVTARDELRAVLQAREAE